MSGTMRWGKQRVLQKLSQTRMEFSLNGAANVQSKRSARRLAIFQGYLRHLRRQKKKEEVQA